MRFINVSLTLFVAILAFNVCAAEYKSLIFEDCGSKNVDIHKVDMTPMPLYNPGDAFFTFIATLKRPVKTLEVTLDIIRTVSGVKLPVKCYLVDGKYVGSCTYPDLCRLFQSILPEFQPGNCPSALAEFGIDCTCPLKIPAQKLNIVDLQIALPDATQTAAKFLASGDFSIQVTAKDDDVAAKQPYGCGKVLLTVKQKK